MHYLHIMSSMLITNVDNPASPYYVAHVTDGADGFTALSNTVFISTTTIDSSTYALVAASNDHGVQIIDITDPSNPEAVSEVRDGVDGFTELLGPRSISTTTIDSSTYALVASSSDSGVQIINITGVFGLSPAGTIENDTSFSINRQCKHIPNRQGNICWNRRSGRIVHHKHYRY